jgi:hypothetical protein
VVFGSRFSGERIVAIEMVADAERLEEFDLVIV